MVDLLKEFGANPDLVEDELITSDLLDRFGAAPEPVVTRDVTPVTSEVTPEEAGIGKILRQPLETAPIFVGQAVGQAAQVAGSAGEKFFAPFTDDPNKNSKQQALDRINRSPFSLGAGLIADAFPSIRKFFTELKETGTATANFGEERLQEERADLNLERNSAKDLLLGTITAVRDMLPAFTATAITRNPAIGGTIMGSQVFGNQFADSKRRGRTDEQATQDGLAMALFEGIPEALVLGKMFKVGKGLTKVVTDALGEGVQEAATTLMEMGYQIGIFNDEITWGEAKKRLLGATVTGIGAGTVFSLAATPLTKKFQEGGIQEKREAIAELKDAAAQQVAEQESLAEKFKQSAVAQQIIEEQSELDFGQRETTGKQQDLDLEVTPEQPAPITEQAELDVAASPIVEQQELPIEQSSQQQELPLEPPAQQTVEEIAQVASTQETIDEANTDQSVRLREELAALRLNITPTPKKRAAEKTKKRAAETKTAEAEARLEKLREPLQGELPLERTPITEQSTLPLEPATAPITEQTELDTTQPERAPITEQDALRLDNVPEQQDIEFEAQAPEPIDASTLNLQQQFKDLDEQKATTAQQKVLLKELGENPGVAEEIQNLTAAVELVGMDPKDITKYIIKPVEQNEIEQTELVLDVRRNGVQTPIVLRQIGDTFEVISGQNVLQAAVFNTDSVSVAVIKEDVNAIQEGEQEETSPVNTQQEAPQSVTTFNVKGEKITVENLNQPNERIIEDTISNENITDQVQEIRTRVKQTKQAQEKVEQTQQTQEQTANSAQPNVTTNQEIPVEQTVNINPDAQVWTRKLKDNWKRQVTDRFRPVKNIQDIIEEQGVNIDPDLDAHLAEQLLHGRTPDQLRLLRLNHQRPLLDAMQEADTSIDELGAFAYAKHAFDRNAAVDERNPQADTRGLNSGMTDQEAQNILDVFEEEGRTNTMEKLSQRLYDMLRFERKLLVSSRLETQKEMDAWEERLGEFYVPLKSQREGGALPRISSKGVQIRGREAKIFIGRSTKAQDIVANVVTQVQQTILRAEKVKVGQALIKLVEKYPDNSFWAIEKRVDRPRFDKKTQEVIYTITPATEGTFVTKLDGKEVHISIADKQMLRALNNTNPESLHAVIRGMGRINRFISLVNTSLSPLFILFNPGRDIQTAIANVQGLKDVQGKLPNFAARLKLSAKIAKDMPRAISAGMSGFNRGSRDYKNLFNSQTSRDWAKMFDEFAEDGGAIQFFALKPIEEINSDMIKELNKGNPSLPSLEKAFRKTVGAGKLINSALENSVRLSVYKNLRDLDVPRPLAARAARNVTVDFSKKGEIGPALNATFLFAAPSIGGSAIILNGMLNSPAIRTIVAGTIFTSFFWDTIARQILGDDEDGRNWMDRIPAHVKQRNYIIPTGEGKEGDHYGTFPQPYGYNVFWVMGSEISAVVHGGATPVQASGNIMSAILGSFNPIAGDENVLKQIVPSSIKPPIEALLFNQDFASRQIKPEQSKFGVPKPESQLYYRGVNPMAKEFTRKLNEMGGGTAAIPSPIPLTDISPEVLEHVITQYVGSAGKFVKDLVRVSTKFAKGEKIESFEIPGVPRLAKTFRSSITINREYETVTSELEIILEEEKRISENETELTMKQFQTEFSGILNLDRDMNFTNKRIRDLYDDIDDVRLTEVEIGSPQEEQQQKEIDDIMKEVHDEKREFNNLYRKATKR